MRSIRSFVFVVLCAVSAFSQRGDWAAVEGLKPGEDLQVKTRQGETYQGELESADPERLVIWSHERSFPGRVVVQRELRRDDVKQVRSNHRYISAGVAAAIGAGVGIGLGAAIDARARSNEDNGLAGAVFGILGGTLGGILGKTHPFIHGAPIYLAP